MKARNLIELDQKIEVEIKKAETVVETAKSRSLSQRSANYWVIRLSNLQFMKEFINAHSMFK